MIEFDPDTLNDPRALRNAFGTFMTGVTVVTTLEDTGQPLGFTANSFASVSLDPPLVLVCLANSSRNYDTFANTSRFAINILAESQIEVSNTFARPVEDRFAKVGWQPGPHGSPILDDVSAWFDCSMFNTVDAGDHLILIGEVKAFDQEIAPGLGYARGAYVTPAAEAKAMSKRTGMIVSALIERNGKILLQDDGNGGLTIPATDDVADGANVALARLISDSGIQAEPGFVFSVYQDEARKHQHISFLCQAADGAPQNGAYTELNASTLMDVADPAICTMLERFARESRIGNFGVYYGNEVSGEVKPLTPGS
ncbi:flavin reductase family protein [Ruegeria sp. 2205SS24-7]|uniref:flavin reductase family protein n=1 Tax=Ruegeria discodermiae TaxID=3064389 RepID=UPI0027406D87|nr:flavin reductase family protein [Ruegeria sp. 2205SS24-7]MDP5220333.1 flavin reductase family protein [Ruegeria sp. 2205SS24-7]